MTISISTLALLTSPTVDGLRGQPAVFVPAVMGAGLVFSLATVARDLFSLSSRAAAANRAQLRGNLVADGVASPDRPTERDSVGLVSRPTLGLVGVLLLVFAGYVLIGTTANFFRDGGYVSDIAWLWGASLVVTVAAAYVGIACLVAAAGSERVAPWTWPILIGTPLVGRHRRFGSGLIERTTIVGGLTLITLLTILATWPHVLEPFDSRVADLVDEDRWIASFESPGRIAGSTKATLAVAVVIGVATLRCRRFAWVFIWSVAASLAITSGLRVVVDRPRPEWGPRVGITDSFPSGHMVQATLLAVLLPLAVHELSRSSMARRVAALGLVIVVVMVAVVAASTGRHHPTDLIAGAAIGLVVGSWARLAVHSPDGHVACRHCVFAGEADALDDRGVESGSIDGGGS